MMKQLISRIARSATILSTSVFALMPLAITAQVAQASEVTNGAPAKASEISLMDFVKDALFESITLSPDGKHLAMIVPKPDRSAFVVLNAESLKPTMNIQLRKDEYIVEANWATNERLVLALGKRFAGFEGASRTGELFATNLDGKRQEYLFGFRGKQSTGTRLKSGVAENAAAFVLNPRANANDQIYIMKRGFEPNAAQALCRLNIYTGNSVCEAGLPGAGRISGILVDDQQKIRFLSLSDINDKGTLYHRKGDSGWTPVDDGSEHTLRPMGWTGVGEEIYVYQVTSKGPTGLAKFDPNSKKLTPQFTPEFASVGSPVYRAGSKQAFAVELLAGKGGIKPLKAGPELDALRTIAPQFPGEIAFPISFSDDGARALVLVTSDVSSPRYYLFETANKKLRDLGSSRPWLDPDLMATTEVFTVKTKDGLSLESFLTLPIGASKDKPAPLILVPHGGPFEIRDSWFFNEETQILASRGYAVLKVNFRGSGGYGDSFVKAGYKEWGQAMQRDLTEAVDHVLKRADIDAKQVAVFGASYGGYAALMAGATEADRYKAVVSYVGVADLELMFTRGDVEDSRYGVSFLKRALGQNALDKYSPVNLAAQMQAPVMLIHGRTDERVPIIHAERMRDALKKVGNEPEWLVEDKEGHGFVNPENESNMYQRLFAFLDKSLK
jgi:dipeptidyl aminopeptidase/acylaminoacyl peptidase